MENDVYLNRVYTATDGAWYRVVREWKHRVRLQKQGGNSGVAALTAEKRELTPPRWREHKMPEKIAKGDVMICNGERCTITSFHNLGGHPFLGVTARWGFQEGHSHENLISFGCASHLITEGLRLPFDGELSA